MIGKASKNLRAKASNAFFKTLHNNCLVYNTCWEDPRIDRQLLKLGAESRVVVITSAGCNTLDYLLDLPKEIYAIDINYRQNALLHLKLAVIGLGNFEDLFRMFGRGSHDSFSELFNSIRGMLPTYAEQFWNNKAFYFDGKRSSRSFYYWGTVGTIAWLLTRWFFTTNKNIKGYVYDLLEANSLQDQKEIFSRIEPELWSAFTLWLMRQPILLALLGAPEPQIRLINEQYLGGVTNYVRDKLKHIMTEVPIKENYFWRVYLTGSYTRTCCPNYLKQENLEVLQQNIERIRVHTSSLSEFLKHYSGPFTHFVLLDHQDWLVWHDPEALKEEWKLILERSQSGTKILVRSAGSNIEFLPDIAKSSVRFFPEMTEIFLKQDRVGTYASLHLGEVL